MPEHGLGFLTSKELAERRRLRAFEEGRMDAVEDRVINEFIIVIIAGFLMFMTFLAAGALDYYFDFNLYESLAVGLKGWWRDR